MTKEGIHPAQEKALIYLLFNLTARYSELNLTGLSTDHFNFHIKQLLKLELIQKNKNLNYMLTTEGKELANRLDMSNRILSKNQKIVVIVGCVRESEAQENEYLFQKRLKQPFFGMHDFLSGRVGWGENIYESAAHILKREAGLTATMTLAGMQHKKDLDSKGKIIEDKYMFIVKATNPKGNLKHKFKAGENFWIKKSQIKNLDKLFTNIPTFINMLKNDRFEFTENSYTNPLY